MLDIVFYKSKISERWWMTVTSASNDKIKFLPCLESDYQDALNDNTTASNNTAVGGFALDSNTTGHSNVAVGTLALDANTTGVQNTAVGHGALGAATTQENSTAVGRAALGVATGAGNNAFGEFAGGGVTTGSTNIFIGKNAGGDTFTTGSSNIIIGCNFNPSNQSNLLAFNNASQTISCSGSANSFTFSSDGRDKTDIVDLTLGLDFINKIRPRKFRWDYRDKSRFPVESKEKPEMLIKAGFIAQEVQEVLKEENAEYTGIVNDKTPDLLEVGASGMIPMMINAIKELSAENTALKARLDAAGL